MFQTRKKVHSHRRRPVFESEIVREINVKWLQKLKKINIKIVKILDLDQIVQLGRVEEGGKSDLEMKLSDHFVFPQPIDQVFRHILLRMIVSEKSSRILNETI